MSPFNVIEHIIPCQHIREYPRATIGEQEEVLHLAVKQYIPKDNPYPQPGDVTIIGAHANGFPKELYEPLWEDLLTSSKKHNFRIRGIWIADVAQQGQSGVLNEEILGNDPSWTDHSRDLLHLINTKRDQMPRPLIGIGHSMGGNHLYLTLLSFREEGSNISRVNLAYMHPRLITTLILIDPVIQQYSSVPQEAGPSPTRLSTFRRDVWPSREAAAQSFKKSKFYQAWDARVLDRWVQYGLRDMPTPTHPVDPYTSGPEQVTLTTTKDQEVFTFLRPNYEGFGQNGKPVNRKTHPDLNPSLPMIYPFYRAEPPAVYARLPELRPSVLYVFGGKSEVCTPENRKEKMSLTGIGVGGSGGAPAGRVKDIVFEDIGHLIAMEAVGRTAHHTSEWIGGEIKQWKEAEEEFNRVWRAKPRLERQMIDEEWKKMIGGPLGRPQSTPSKL